MGLGFPIIFKEYSDWRQCKVDEIRRIYRDSFLNYDVWVDMLNNDGICFEPIILFGAFQLC